MDRRIFHLQEQLLKSPQQNWTIEKMPELVELSVSHIQKLFKIETAIAPKTFLRDLRLEGELNRCNLCEYHTVTYIFGLNNYSKLNLSQNFAERCFPFIQLIQQ